MSVSVVTADTAVPGTMTRTEHCSLSMGKPLALCAPLDSRGKPLALCAPLDSSCQPCNLSQSHVAWAKLRPKTSRLCLLHLRWNSPPIDHNTVWGWGVSQMHLLTNTCTAHTLTSPPHHHCNHPHTLTSPSHPSQPPHILTSPSQLLHTFTSPSHAHLTDQGLAMKCLTFCLPGNLNLALLKASMQDASCWGLERMDMIG